MSWHLIDEIIAPLRYTNMEVHYDYGYLNMMNMEEAGKKITRDKLNPSWINILNKSMM